MSFLGLDIGTTGVKSLVFDHKGKVLAESYREYGLIYLKQGWVELDPVKIIDCAIDVLKQSAGRCKNIDPVEVMGISCLGSVMVPLDKNDCFLYNGFSFMDTRSVESLKDLIGMDHFEFYRITGLHINPYLTLNKILWLRENRPDVYKKTSKFYSLKEILMLKLGIEPKTDHCLASLTMMYDLNNEVWSQKIFDNCGLDMGRFPKIEESWEIAGEINGKYLDLLGLDKTIDVIVGGADTGACPLGAGIISPGSVSNTIGTFEEAVLVLDKIILTREMMKAGISCHRSLIPGSYLFVGLPTTGGFILKWFKEKFCSFEKKDAEDSGTDIYDYLLEDIEDIRTDVLFLPHLNGAGTPYMDQDSRGAFLKISSGTEKKDFIKAIIEGLNYEIKLMLKFYRDKISKIQDFYVTGGAAKSGPWMQVKADILETNIKTATVTEAGSLGAALLAAFSTGDFNDMKSAVKSMVKPGKTYNYNHGNLNYYRSKYDTYKRLCKVIKKIW